MVMGGREKDRCDNEGFLILFFSHVLDLDSHFVGSKETEEGHGDRFALTNDAKIGVEDDVSRSLLWIDRSRRFENNDARNRDGTGGCHGCKNESCLRVTSSVGVKCMENVLLRRHRDVSI